jgi:hypothetical protein
LTGGILNLLKIEVTKLGLHRLFPYYTFPDIRLPEMRA